MLNLKLTHSKGLAAQPNQPTLTWAKLTCTEVNVLGSPPFGDQSPTTCPTKSTRVRKGPGDRCVMVWLSCEQVASIQV